MKKTQKQRVIEKLLADGEASNYWSIETKTSLRLGAIIFELIKDGYEFDQEKSGFAPNSKNWVYVLKNAPPKPPRYEYIPKVQEDGSIVRQPILIA